MTIAGFYKGKWWLQRDASQQAATTSDILFELKSSNDHVILGTQYSSLGQVVKAKRGVSPADAHVGFHSLRDAPTSDDPSHFEVALSHKLHFKAEDIPSKSEDDKAKISAQNLAGTLPIAAWQTWATELTFAGGRQGPSACPPIHHIKSTFSNSRELSCGIGGSPSQEGGRCENGVSRKQT